MKIPVWLNQRIDRTLAGTRIREDMKRARVLSLEERYLLAEMRKHPGKENAIRRKDLELYFCTIHEREIRATLKTLIEEFGIPIGSTSRDGYFLVVTDEDRRSTIADLTARIRSLNGRIRCLSTPDEKQGGLFG